MPEKDEEKDLQQVLTEMPWSAILVPLGLSLLVIVVVIALVVWDSK